MPVPSNETSKPMYEQIYTDLRDAICSGRYLPGDRVPSEKELAEQYGVSRITTKKALEMIAADGLILRQPGRGSFVTDGPAVTPTKSGAISTPPWLGENRPPLFGLIMTDFDDSYGTGLLSGIEKAAAEQNALLLLRRSFGDPQREATAIHALLDCGVDGLVIFPAQNEHFSAEILKLVIDQFPLVLVDRYLKGVAATAVSTDNVLAARLGTDYLLNLGHRHIGLLTAPPMDTTAIEDRIEGFVQAHAERGVMVDKALWLTSITSTLPNSFHEPNIARDVEQIKAHLQQNPQITAFMTIEYNIALLARMAAEQSGLSVPGDLSILCFDNPATLGCYQFTHILQAQELMGRTALDSVLRLKNGERLPPKMLLEAELVEGQSTGPARS